MLRDLAKIRDILTPAERRKAAGMLVLVVLMALAETLGVLSIMPFLSVLGRPAMIHENPWLQRAYSASGFAGGRQFIVALGIASICVVIASSAFKVATQHSINRFVHLLRHSISSRLLSRYLHQPYAFFLSRNTADLSKNILSETDQLLFNLTGGGPTPSPAYKLDVKLSSTQLQVIVDIYSARPEIQNYGIDAVYTLVDNATGKTVVKGTTFSRVSYNIPGQQQRFAGDRGLRDAEDRAAKVIADNIRNRLASYFTAGT